MALTQEAILSFLLEHGGKVKNSELLNNFRSLISCSDPAEKQHNRDVFKKLVNSVAVVKQIDEVKFVVVKKRYQDFVKEGTHSVSLQSHDSSFSCSSPTHASAGMTYSDFENNNVCFPSKRNGDYHSDAKHASAGCVQDRRSLSRNSSGADTTTVKVLNLSGDQASKAGKSGAVFAVIAVKSPPRDPAPADHHRSISAVHQTHNLVNKVPPTSVKNLDFPVCKKAAQNDSQSCKNKQNEDVQPPVFPHTRPQSKSQKQGEDAKESECVPLDPLAHEWLVKCAAGLWGHIHGLLLQDTRLAQKRDFMSGFTALHWAAKDGNSHMIHKLVEISRKRGTYVDINSKAHGGYTPLHIAAIHGHTEVMVLLVKSYGANANERDNDGKKALHYLDKGVSAEVRTLLGGQQQSRSREKTEEEEGKEQTKSFNTISKLFQPHGKKQKTAVRYAQDW